MVNSIVADLKKVIHDKTLDNISEIFKKNL